MKNKRNKYPLATLAFYGPTDRLATKAVVGIVPREGGDVDELRRWIVDTGDIRHDPVTGEEIKGFLKKHHVKSVITYDRIIGCPHEEGKDYPEGEDCPLCPFWADRDRFTGEIKE